MDNDLLKMYDNPEVSHDNVDLGKLKIEDANGTVFDGNSGFSIIHSNLEKPNACFKRQDEITTHKVGARGQQYFSWGTKDGIAGSIVLKTMDLQCNNGPVCKLMNIRVKERDRMSSTHNWAKCFCKTFKVTGRILRPPNSNYSQNFLSKKYEPATVTCTAPDRKTRARWMKTLYDEYTKKQYKEVLPKECTDIDDFTANKYGYACFPGKEKDKDHFVIVIYRFENEIYFGWVDLEHNDVLQSLLLRTCTVDDSPVHHTIPAGKKKGFADYFSIEGNVIGKGHKGIEGIKDEPNVKMFFGTGMTFIGEPRRMRSEWVVEIQSMIEKAKAEYAQRQR